MATNDYIAVNLEFLENHLPGLKAGEYKITVNQNLTAPGIDSPYNPAYANPDGGANPAEFYVQVAGERFSINPTEIHSVFPPDHSLGEYSNVLPHIILNRSTLPWERLAMEVDPVDTNQQENNEKVPWLALLVFNEDELLMSDGSKPANPTERLEAESGKTVAYQDFIASFNLPEEPGQDPNEKARIIYVDAATLANILPRDSQELTYLAHARKTSLGVTLQNTTFTGPVVVTVKDAKGKVRHREHLEQTTAGAHLSVNPGTLQPGTYSLEMAYNGTTESGTITLGENDQVGLEVAVVMANRLPKPGVKTIVHLVSLEERYTQPSGTAPNKIYSFQGSGTVPLISLKSWSFTAVEPMQTFRNILLHLNHDFLFGFAVPDPLPALAVGQAVPQPIRDAFQSGGHLLSDKATIYDTCAFQIKDPNHQYYVGESKQLYNAAGKGLGQLAAMPTDQEVMAGKIGSQPLSTKGIATTHTDLCFWVQDGTKYYFVRQLSQGNRAEVRRVWNDEKPVLRLPEVEDSTTQANSYLRQGYAPFPHFFRRGGKSLSWYRSPLLPGKPEKQIADSQFPASCSDELLRYFTEEGMFDVSYAAAWELGRLQALKSKRFSVSLYNWKRTHRQQIHAALQQELYTHLPFQEASPVLTLPENIEQWLSKLSLLKALPFNYLVPDERMLPVESIRFFYLDPSWVAALVDGALSIGRVPGMKEKKVSPHTFLDTAAAGNPITGILVRSSVIKGWPALQVNGFDYTNWPNDMEKNNTIKDGSGDPIKPLPILRMERLSPNVLLVLFQGEANVVDIHEKPEVVHFGFEDKGEGTYVKEPVNSAGVQTQTYEIQINPPLLETNRRLNITNLFNDLSAKAKDLNYNQFTSAQFALSMVEGVDRVRFIMG